MNSILYKFQWRSRKLIFWFWWNCWSRTPECVKNCWRNTFWSEIVLKSYQFVVCWLKNWKSKQKVQIVVLGSTCTHASLSCTIGLSSCDSGIWFVGLKSRSDCSYGKMISIVDERRAIVWFNGYVIIKWLIWKCEFDFENRLIGLNAKNIRIWVSKIMSAFDD